MGISTDEVGVAGQEFWTTVGENGEDESSSDDDDEESSLDEED